MSNDRLFIVCGYCGEAEGLGSYGPGLYLNTGDAGKRMAVFVDAHINQCHPNIHDVDLGAESGLRIVTEDGAIALKREIKDGVVTPPSLEPVPMDNPRPPVS